jgi:hypothetical protein
MPEILVGLSYSMDLFSFLRLFHTASRVPEELQTVGRKSQGTDHAVTTFLAYSSELTIRSSLRRQCIAHRL